MMIVLLRLTCFTQHNSLQAGLQPTTHPGWPHVDWADPLRPGGVDPGQTGPDQSRRLRPHRCFHSGEFYSNSPTLLPRPQMSSPWGGGGGHLSLRPAAQVRKQREETQVTSERGERGSDGGTGHGAPAPGGGIMSTSCRLRLPAALGKIQKPINLRQGASLPLKPL